MIFIGSASSCDCLGGTWWAARYGVWIEVSKSKQYIKLGEQIQIFKTIGSKIKIILFYRCKIVISKIFNLFYLDFKQFI